MREKAHAETADRVVPSRPVTTAYTPAQARVLEQQRTVGNQAVVQRMPMEDTPGHRVISGHGRFSEQHLESERRKKLVRFTVPDGVTIHVYAPDGAALENDVANLVEEGNPPGSGEVELVYGDTGETQDVSGGYPYRFGPGSEMVNYTIYPPDKLITKGEPKTYRQPTSLFTAVNELAEQGYTDIHFACCSRSYAVKDAHREAMPWNGWYVRLKE